MKEKLHKQTEKGQEYLSDTHDVIKPNNEIQAPPTESADAHNHSIDKLQESIHKTALSSEEITIEQPKHDAPGQTVFGLQRELKRDAYTKTIRKIHSQLAPAERTFSKLIHHKTIEPISEIGSKTVGRPSGILGSGITALIGSTVVLFMAKYYGFEYNLSIFFILLGIGFFAGIFIEIITHAINKRKNSSRI